MLFGKMYIHSKAQQKETVAGKKKRMNQVIPYELLFIITCNYFTR